MTFFYYRNTYPQNKYLIPVIKIVQRARFHSIRRDRIRREETQTPYAPIRWRFSAPRPPSHARAQSATTQRGRGREGWARGGAYRGRRRERGGAYYPTAPQGADRFCAGGVAQNHFLPPLLHWLPRETKPERGSSGPQHPPISLRTSPPHTFPRSIAPGRSLDYARLRAEAGD